MIELLRYQRDDGREPFSEWLNGLRDKVAQARIRIRLRQAADIKRAKDLWAEWKRRQG